MKIRPLVLDENSLSEIKRVRIYAENFPYSTSMVKEVQSGNRLIPGDDPKYSCVVPMGYRCVFTLDQVMLKDSSEVVWTRHLSVSINDNAYMPSPHAINALMKEFGFRQELCDKKGNPVGAELAVWAENEDNPNKPIAINVGETYDP